MKTAEALELMTQEQMCWTRLRQLTIQKVNGNVESRSDWHSEVWALSECIDTGRKLEDKYLSGLIEAIVKNKQSTEIEE